MAVDLKNLNQNQLNDLISKAEQRKVEIEKEKLTKLRERVQKMIKDEGFAVEDVFGGRRTRRTASKVAPKYRNPADASQTWSGRGKRPRWFNAALKAGKKEKDLLIK